MQYDPQKTKLTIGGVKVEIPIVKEFKPMRSPVAFALFTIDPMSIESVKENKNVHFLAQSLQGIYLFSGECHDEKQKTALCESFNMLHDLLKKEGVSITTECLEYFYSL
jgi:hypothetical protein